MPVSGVSSEKGGAEVVWQSSGYHDGSGCGIIPCCREAGYIFHISEK